MTLLESNKVDRGAKAHDFELPGIDDRKHSLSEFGGAEALVIFFMCNHCPYVQAVWDRLVALQDRFKDKGVKFVGINPNLNPNYPEENLEKMKEYAHKYHMNFPYLLDESQEVAREYGAVCTPDIFVYNKNLELTYRGRIDDNWKEVEKVQNEELAAALEAMVAGEEVSDQQNPSMGCSIKWRE